MTLKTAPYGTWESPISAETFTKGANNILDVIVDRVTSQVYHIEGRPSEAGRSVLVHTASGSDVVGKEWNVRTTVHEYGGTPALVHDGVVYFSNLADGRVYRIRKGGEPEAVTLEGPYRYACLEPHPSIPHLLVSVLEDHTIDEPASIQNRIVLIDTSKSQIQTLIQGSDFYAFPKFSPDGKKLAWQQWDHPDIPWEGSQIYIADVGEGQDGGLAINNEILIAGEAEKISASYPDWVDEEKLIFTSDSSGYINPWLYSSTNKKATALLPLPISEDFGYPLWVLNYFPYAILHSDSGRSKAVFSALRDGRDVLYILDLQDPSPPKQIEAPFLAIQCVRLLSKENEEIVIIGQTAIGKKGIFKISLKGETEIVTLKATEASNGLTTDLVSLPQPITLDGVHTVFYPPHNPAYKGSSIEGEKPPCVVNVHGGPTALSGQGLDWGKQYFTSRGWAWLDVNYGGSSGYGRTYIQRLASNWGVVDVNDTILATKSLSSPPYSLIDPKRAVIRGGSAGGYTVLASLSLPSSPADLKVFAAGTSLYGISDLEKLAEFTHKFESHYLYKLVGGTVEEVPEVYKARSPVHHAERIVSPLLLLQGEIDKVVPKGQSDLIYNTIKDRGGRVEYKLYPGEGHGWRKEETMVDAYERELGFYEAVLGLRNV